MNYVIKIDKSEHIELVLRHEKFKKYVHNHTFNKFIDSNGFIYNEKLPFNKKFELNDIIGEAKKIKRYWLIFQLYEVYITSWDEKILPDKFKKFKQLTSTQLLRNKKLKRINYEK